MIRSMSSGSRPAVRIARRPATAPIVAVVSCAAATRRSRIPVRADDPLVGRVDHALEVGVGEDLLGRVAAPAGDADGARRGPSCGLHLDQRLLGLDQGAASAQIRTTRPATSLLISLNSFIASIRPMTWPTDTWLPTATYGVAPGRRRDVVDAGERGLDRRTLRGGAARRRGRGASRCAAASWAGRRRPRPPVRPGDGPTAAGARRMIVVPPASTSSSARSLRSSTAVRRSTRSSSEASPGSRRWPAVGARRRHGATARAVQGVHLGRPGVADLHLGVTRPHRHGFHDAGSPAGPDRSSPGLLVLRAAASRPHARTAEHERRVLAAEPERVGHRRPDLARVPRAGDEVEARRRRRPGPRG